MRNIIKFSLLLPFLFVFYGCPDCGKDEVCRAIDIKNNSDKNVKLKFYIKRSKELIVTHDIESSKYIYYATDCQEKTFKDIENPNLYNSIDSVRIIFNNSKVLIHTYDENTKVFSSPVNRNILKVANYEANGKDIFFTITNEEYNQAVDCGASCE